MKQSSLQSYFKKLSNPINDPEIEQEPDSIDVEVSNITPVNEPNLGVCSGSALSIEIEGVDNSRPNNCDISLNRDDKPVQPNITFPKTQLGVKSRSFNTNWYTKFPHLEYSVKLDSIFCFICRHFGTTSLSQLSPFITGYKDWAHIGNAVPKHFSNSNHQNSLEKYYSYQQSNKTGTVLNQMSSQRLKQIENNRKLLAAHVEVILLCGRQEISLRGHREQLDNDNTNNIGNFLSISNLLKKHDTCLLEISKSMPNNATYTSPDIQNEIISTCGSLIRKEILNEVKEFGEIFSIIADEAKDNSGYEQLSICIRYATNQKIKESFLGFVRLHKFDAATISASIINFLEEIGLNFKNISSQSFDGASVMRGDTGGVHSIIESKIGVCPYVHCYAHRLNLVLVNTCSEIIMVRDILGLLQAIYNFQSNSVKRAEYFINSQSALGHSKILKMPKSCPTRWSSKAKVVSYFKLKLDSVLLALKNICENGEPMEKAECLGYITQLCSFKVVFILNILDEIFTLTNMLSEYLQSADIFYNQAVIMCNATIKTINEMRTIEKFQQFWKQIEKSSERIGAEHPLEATPKRAKIHSTRLIGFSLSSTTGYRQAEASSDFNEIYKDVFFEIIDKITKEMTRRFTKNEFLARGVTASDPKSSTFLNETDVISFCEKYSRFFINISSLKSQLAVAKNLFIAEELTTPFQCYKSLLLMKDSFNDLLKYFSIVLSIPVSSATSERSFSTLKRVKNYMRTSSGQSRTSDLCLISTDNDFSLKLYENPLLVVDYFAKFSKRRLEFLI